MEDFNVAVQQDSLPEEPAANADTDAVRTEEPATDAEDAPSAQAGEIPEKEDAVSAAQADEASETTEEPATDAESRETRIRVKFNKRERSYTPEEAAPLVEMGLKWDSFRENHEKLKYLALSHGKTVGELIDTLMDGNDKLLYRQTLSECGGNEAAAQKLFAMQQSARRQKFDEAAAREQGQGAEEEVRERGRLQQRLADEYAVLSQEMPGKFSKFADIPAPVVREAVGENIPLMDAYLRFAYRESKKREAERAAQADLAKRSAGPLGGERTAPEPALDSFERAFHRALW